MRRLLRILVPAALVLVALSCSATSTTSTSSDDGPPPTARPDTTEPSDDEAESRDERTELRDVPELVLPSEPVGSAQAYDDLIDRLERFITEEQLAEGVPWPDLRNPDPVTAYQATATFQQWMMQNNPSPPLTEAYTAPNSPERNFDLEMFDLQSRLNAVSTPDEPPYSMQVEAVVHPAATSITDTLLADVPDGSVAVVYYDSSGRSQMITESGLVISESDGWTNVGPWVAIMEPTEVGWQVWWDELTDPLPPGQDYERRQSGDTDKPRQDL